MPAGSLIPPASHVRPVRDSVPGRAGATAKSEPLSAADADALLPFPSRRLCVHRPGTGVAFHAVRPKSVLAFLSNRFEIHQKELVVTEGIGHVLRCYPSARDSVIAALATEAIAQADREKIVFVCEARGLEDNFAN